MVPITVSEPDQKGDRTKMLFRATHRRFLILLTVLFAGIFVSACEMVEEVFEDPVPPPCPTVSILANGERITQFRSGPGRDLIDITAEARIDDFIARCIYEVDEDTGVGQVHVELSLGVSAARGAANTSGTADLPYFISINALDKTILTKRAFMIRALFEGNRYRISAYDEPVILSIPIQPPQTGEDFLIYVGFQLTPEQLEYNRFLRETGN